MKNFKFYTWLLAIFISTALFVSCSNDDSTSGSENPDPIETSHFDVWVSIGGNSGMNSSNSQLVRGVKSLETQEILNFTGTGVDITSKLYQETIYKGQYYYQVPREKDRIGKYKIGDKNYEVIQECAFKNNTLKDRRYTYAWIADNSLVFMAANGDASKVIWIKVDTDNMKIVSEGELDLPSLPAGGTFSTSGIAAYRKSDNTIIYTYLNNKNKTKFYAAFINPASMSVEKTVEENRAEFMAGTAYGELLQSKSFFDAEGNYYLACNSVREGAPSTTQQSGTVLRINKNETSFDDTYTGFKGANYSRGKIVTIEYLTVGKALLYIQDPEHTGAESWGGTYNCYYAILDISTDQLKPLDLPFSEGTFSQRSLVLGNKAYIGVNPKDGAPAIYVYDIKTESLTKGVEIQEGYSFDRIVNVQN